MIRQHPSECFSSFDLGTRTPLAGFHGLSSACISHLQVCFFTKQRACCCRCCQVQFSLQLTLTNPLGAKRLSANSFLIALEISDKISRNRYAKYTPATPLSSESVSRSRGRTKTTMHSTEAALPERELSKALFLLSGLRAGGTEGLLPRLTALSERTEQARPKVGFCALLIFNSHHPVVTRETRPLGNHKTKSPTSASCARAACSIGVNRDGREDFFRL